MAEGPVLDAVCFLGGRVPAIELAAAAAGARIVHGIAHARFSSIVVVDLGSTRDSRRAGADVAAARAVAPRDSFILLWNICADSAASLRHSAFVEGANMVSGDGSAVETVFRQILGMSRRGTLVCPFCDRQGLTEDDLWKHCPLFHVYQPNRTMQCPCCQEVCTMPRVPFPVHLRNEHGPCARGEVAKETSTGIFGIVLCRRRNGHVLLVQEFAGLGFWTPGGQVDPGESLCAAVARECEEEAGVAVTLTGIVDINVRSLSGGRLWRRVVFVGEPQDENACPKSIPDFESAGAVWADPMELEQLPLRGDEPLTYYRMLQKGVQVMPLQIPPEFQEVFADVPF
mmetsp:Transcript_11932/g.26356  ORF Transcript_11932/g.26356 Transcript_11932/m.26356 type:complete len:342 (+) Transcript_11932:69-1094(+)